MAVDEAWIPVIVAAVAAISGWIPLILQRRKNSADIASVLTTSSIALINEKDESTAQLRDEVRALRAELKAAKEELRGAYRTIRQQQEQMEAQQVKHDSEIRALQKELAAFKKKVNGER